LSPLPHQVCLLSHEKVGFDHVPVQSIERRIVTLVCMRGCGPISFEWDETHPLMRSKMVSIRPSHGEIADGDRCVCVVELRATHVPQVVETTISCDVHCIPAQNSQTNAVALRGGKRASVNLGSSSVDHHSPQLEPASAPLVPRRKVDGVGAIGSPMQPVLPPIMQGIPPAAHPGDSASRPAPLQRSDYS
jgi:hypothetical protein